MLALKIRMMWPEAKECRHPLEARRGKEWILLKNLWRDCSPDTTLIWA